MSKTTEDIKAEDGAVSSILTRRQSILNNIGKMGHTQLEQLVNELIRCSSPELSNCAFTNCDMPTPVWWPSNVTFVNPVSDVKPKEYESNWTTLLASIVESYASFHKLKCSISSDSNAEMVLKQAEGAIKHAYASVCINVINESNINLKDWCPFVKVTDINNSPKNVIGSRSCDDCHHHMGTKRKRTVDEVLEELNIKKNTALRLARKVKKMDPLILYRQPYVKLEDLLVTPKPRTWSKEGFMNYFSLTSKPQEKVSTTRRHTLRHFSKINEIPVCSELGQLSMTKISAEHALFKIERSEYYVKQKPTVTLSKEYKVTYERQNKHSDNHIYQFPKRQYHQEHISLKTYSRIKLCQPVSVVLERMDFDKLHKNLPQEGRVSCK